VNIFIEEYEN